MSILPWVKRKARLNKLPKRHDEDEDAAALALDRILHGQNVIGATCMMVLFLCFAVRSLTVLQPKQTKSRICDSETRISTLLEHWNMANMVSYVPMMLIHANLCLNFCSRLTLLRVNWMERYTFASPSRNVLLSRPVTFVASPYIRLLHLTSDMSPLDSNVLLNLSATFS